MGSQYGLGTAIADVKKGYERQEDREAGKAAGAQKSEMNRFKLDEMRAEAEAEGSKEAIKMMLRGDLQGAMDKYNQQGEDRMSNLQFDQGEGVVSWTNAAGEQHITMLPQLMSSVGLDPADLDTPDAKLGRDKDLVEHKAKMAKKYGIGRAGGKPTAYIQNLEYTMKTLTGGDPKSAFKLMQLSKSDPQAAYARILLGLQKQNQEAFGDERQTEEEMRIAAKDSVTSFRDDMFNELIQPGGGQQEAPPPSQNDPLGLL